MCGYLGVYVTVRANVRYSGAGVQVVVSLRICVLGSKFWLSIWAVHETNNWDISPDFSSAIRFPGKWEIRENLKWLCRHSCLPATKSQLTLLSTNETKQNKTKMTLLGNRSEGCLNLPAWVSVFSLPMYFNAHPWNCICNQESNP